MQVVIDLIIVSQVSLVVVLFCKVSNNLAMINVSAAASSNAHVS